MSRVISHEQFCANVAHWQFQDRMMRDQGFPKAYRTTTGGLPRAYESACGEWRISTAMSRKWKLEIWTGRMYRPPGTGAAFKVWTASTRRFDTPLAVALWFHLFTRGGKLKGWAQL